MLRSFDLVPLLLGLEKLPLRSILTSPDLSNITHFKANMYDLPQQLEMIPKQHFRSCFNLVNELDANMHL